MPNPLTELEPIAGTTVGNFTEAPTKPEPLAQFPSGMILQACPDIAEYRPSGETPRNWRHFIEATRLLRPMSGISRDAWSAATTAVGEKSLATALAAILQRFEHSSEARMVLSSTDGANSCEVNGSPAIKSPSASPISTRASSVEHDVAR